MEVKHAELPVDQLESEIGAALCDFLIGELLVNEGDYGSYC